MINKTQEVRGDEEFEKYSDYGQSAKEKSVNQTKKNFKKKYFTCKG